MGSRAPIRRSTRCVLTCCVRRSHSRRVLSQFGFRKYVEWENPDVLVITEASLPEGDLEKLKDDPKIQDLAFLKPRYPVRSSLTSLRFSAHSFAVAVHLLGQGNWQDRRFLQAAGPRRHLWLPQRNGLRPRGRRVSFVVSLPHTSQTDADCRGNHSRV